VTVKKVIQGHCEQNVKDIQYHRITSSEYGCHSVRLHADEVTKAIWTWNLCKCRSAGV